MIDPVAIFTNRVADYVLYRPGYPKGIIDLLRTECQLRPISQLADIGSGTGNLAKIFLENGNHVFGVEPNPEMRRAAEKILAHYPNFNSIDGRAETTGLDSCSIDFITIGQAFHWFATEETKKEFNRILRVDGWVVIFYNALRTNTPFTVAYAQFNHKYLGDKDPGEKHPDIYSPFFGEGRFTGKILDGVTQRLTFEGLVGRVKSRVNSPQECEDMYQEMMKALRGIFDRHHQDGKVLIDYNTQVIYGRI